MNVRDHLANERTFLAWVRTALALLGFGILLVKLRFLGITPHAGVGSARLGMAFAAAGILTLLVAVWHYVRTRRMIDGSEYRAPTSVILAFAAVIFGLGLLCIIYLLTLL